VSDTESIVTETASRIFSDFADPQTINRAKDDRWKAPLWQALSEAGLPLAWVPEDYGGSGVSLADGFEVLTVAGRFAAPVPIAETLLAGWLLTQGELWSPPGALTVAPARPDDRIVLDADGTLCGRARGVPFAGEAGHFAVLAHAEDGPTIALVDAKAVQIAAGRTLGGDAAGVVTFDHVRPRERGRAPKGFDQEALMLMGCTVRSVETAGALETVLATSVRYAGERVAFERPIGKFQAVQHNLARLAGEVAAAMTAAGSAADAIANAESFDDAVFLEAASAKVRAAEAAEEGAAIAHQVHGAIGFTQEHVLHRFTLRMLGWRDDFGSESYWAAELGRRIAARGADAFWPLAASR
jgi:alkylation response protein AidB-like acyl-CoA dehydrogenase